VPGAGPGAKTFYTKGAFALDLLMHLKEKG
jgi:hypothetical protein